MKERQQPRRRGRSELAACDRAGWPDADQWAPIVVGEPIFDFEPRPPAALSYRPDTICDGWSTEHFTVRLASVRGYSHRYNGSPRQDDAEAAFHRKSGSVIFAVADGVSNARYAHLGATAACRSAMQSLHAQLDVGIEAVSWVAVLDQTVRGLTAQAAVTLGDDHPTPAVVLDLFATTLVAGYVAVDKAGAVASMVQVGDTSAWILCDDRYRHVLKTKRDPREQVISSAVAPLPQIPRPITSATVRLHQDVVLLVGTDGFGDPLGDGDGQVGLLFASQLRTPPSGHSFAHLLDFSRETFDDDRTLVGIWPRAVNSETPR